MFSVMIMNKRSFLSRLLCHQQPERLLLITVVQAQPRVHLSLPSVRVLSSDQRAMMLFFLQARQDIFQSILHVLLRSPPVWQIWKMNLKIYQSQNQSRVQYPRGVKLAIVPVIIILLQMHLLDVPLAIVVVVIAWSYIVSVLRTAGIATVSAIAWLVLTTLVTKRNERRLYSRCLIGIPTVLIVMWTKRWWIGEWFMV